MTHGAIVRTIRNEAGASLVEFALILPLLMALLLGIFTGGAAYNRKISITNAVREGARYGATLACSHSCVTGGNWIAQVKQRVVDASGGELKLSDVCAWVGNAGSTACGIADPANAAGTMLVKVEAHKQANLDVVFFRYTVTLSSKSTARYERQAAYDQ